MAKGMSIEELRKSLESDATKQLDELKAKNEQLEKTNKEMLELLKEKSEDLIEKRKAIVQLQNRCHAFTRGVMCGHCGFSFSCPNSPATKFMKATGLMV